MPRCPNGTRKNKKTGECEPKKIASKPESNQEKTRKRCPKGTRKDKKTSECKKVSETHKIEQNKRPVRVNKKKNMKMFKITKIDYVYPTIVDENQMNPQDYGVMNVSSIHMENDDYTTIIEFNTSKKMFEFILVEKQNDMEIDDDKQVRSLLKKSVNLEDLKKTPLSSIRFFGTENDDDFNYTTQQNVKSIKDCDFGEMIKIKVTGKDAFYTLDDLNDADKLQVLNETIDIIKKRI